MGNQVKEEGRGYGEDTVIKGLFKGLVVHMCFRVQASLERKSKQFDDAVEWVPDLE